MPRRLASAPPQGLVYVPELVGVEEERALVQALEGLPLRSFEMHGVVARRRVAHFGWDYGYESWKITPAAPMPAFLEPLRTRAAQVINAAPAALEEVLVTLYPPGAGIGWHRDAPMFGPSVIGVSLLGACRMRFRRKRDDGFESYTQPLAPRSLYVLAGEARAVWQHSIPAVEVARWSVTFRTVVRRPHDEG